MVPVPKQGLQEHQTLTLAPSCPVPLLSVCNVSSAGIARERRLVFSCCLILIIGSAVKVNIMEAPLKDTQCILVSGQRKMYLCTTFKQPSGKLACAVWGPCRAVSYERQAGGLPAALEEDRGGA